MPVISIMKPCSIQGPLLVINYITDLPNILKSCCIHLFMDDTLVCVDRSELTQLVNTINKESGQINCS